MNNKWMLISLLLILTSQITLAKNYYRYTNEQGNVEISDKINKKMELTGYEIIGHKGTVIKRVAAARTLAEIHADKLRKLEENHQKILFRQQLRRDAELLKQFASIGDIIRNRDSQLLALEQRIRIQSSKEELLNLQLEDQQQQAATYERLGQKVSKTLLKDIQGSQNQIVINQINTEQLEKEKIRIEKSFELDIVRFKKLESVRIALKKNKRKKEETEPVIFSCDTLKICDRAWQLAQIYARDNATGKIEIITNTLILTSRPTKDTDVAISFSKIPAPNYKKEIVLEVSCSQNEVGVAFCKTPKLIQLRKNYIPYIQSRME